ncbi:multisubunit potassium/proton antiporter, PhaD subunit [Pseudoxanthomonas sp. GM95]|uniref:monovalent cation/H+ antiporter subunit D n=1 Tax=Pseudoxanthomonas sp. GM95 TaxID=1881043 RepID=UPI0008BB4EA7|nr:monovalent cation/H+ antiporter subunit D [Pseudoxanthomonas sp. GM95]SEK40561.1 multisubunit potassium/proton antiporter, PhaD subunit [Pseudoxanthomonas sp. GM95]
MNHLPILPVLIPMAGAAASLIVEHNRFGFTVRRTVAWLAMAALVVVVAMLVIGASSGHVDAYLLGDWPARLGITLVADRLSVWMVAVTTLLACACLLHACAGWDARAPHFHALFQFQLMGLNGAFLTGDIFNLFVFFEVMLIASYGLLLSGGRGLGMRNGFHYVVFNVTASSLFLIALGLIYGLLGTLNMAELAVRIAQVPPANLALVKAAIGLLLVVFCAKAALLPLYLWLPETYARAPAAVSALFAVMTKVGLYAVLRVSTVLLGAGAGAMAGYGQSWLLVLGAATLIVAALGVLGSARLRVMIGYLVVWSAATLFVAFSLGGAGTMAAGLYYLAHSCFTAAALFLIADLIRRRRGAAGDDKSIPAPLPGRTVPGVLFLIAAVAVAGLPPLSGFLGKVALLASTPVAHTGLVWSTVLLSSLMVIIGVSRAGVRLFWRVPAQIHEAGPVNPAPARPAETAAAIVLLTCVVGMSVFAEPLLTYADATAQQLLDTAGYVDHIRGLVPAMREP